MDCSVREVNGKHRARFGMSGQSENPPTLFHEEYPDRYVEVCVAGFLVVIEYTDAVLCPTENTPTLLPALRGEGGE